MGPLTSGLGNLVNVKCDLTLVEGLLSPGLSLISFTLPQALSIAPAKFFSSSPVFTTHSVPLGQGGGGAGAG